MLRHPLIFKLLRDIDFMKNFKAVIVDEAHCTTQWGDTFRRSYSELGRLRSFFPQNCPFLATAATATPDDVEKITKALHF